MRILADDNIPSIRDACAGLGDVTLYAANDAAALPALLRETDAFLCRSTVKVGEDLIKDTPVRFVATATSGTEHIDVGALEARGIRVASAAGSNALSVAEYVFAALFTLGCARGFDPRGKSIGIIGAGHVGTWVAHIAERLGMTVILNDPPKQDATGDAVYRPIRDALQADIVTLHVPLTADGPHPTRKLVADREFQSMRDGVIFINTARGGVVDTPALLRAIDGRKTGAVILDVFPGEPAANPQLIRAADIATAHIAGHSHDGKLLGTQMVTEALCAFAGAASAWSYLDVLGVAPGLHLPSDASLPLPCRVNDVLAQAFDISADHAALLAMTFGPFGEIPRAFAAFRNAYPQRREFHAHRLPGDGADRELSNTLLALGFQLE
ncbi:MAG: 4-phosphoerythronate dehydrogenase [Ignavibacteria bacterium]|nr:4-phosphoerythronate dehydrogenase [Ignavibacteria bacterium]